MKPHECTIVLPVSNILPSWWPLLQANVKGKIILGKKGETGVVKYPSKHGWQLDQEGLPWELAAFRLSF
jgi:hypothetical protein